MWGELRRRLLWLPLTIVGVTLLTFALLSPAIGGSPSQNPFAHLPRFVNLSPRDMRARTSEAMAALAIEDSPEAREKIAELGGASFPALLPALDGLSPSERARIALALAPVAKRMGLVEPSSESSLPAAAWVRFWDDHALDWKPAAIRRTVRRYAEHPSPSRRRDLAALDTAALDEIMTLLANGPGADGRDETLRLTRAAAHTLGRAELDDGASDEAIAGEVAKLHAFWLAHRLEMTTLDGPGRATAIALETQYAKWAERALSGDRSSARGGTPSLIELARAFLSTALVIAAGSALGAVVALALSFASVVVRRRAVDACFFALIALVGAAPSLDVASLSTSPRTAALLTFAAAMSLMFSVRMRATWADLADAPHVVAARARGASFARAMAAEAKRAALPILLPLLALELPMLLGAAFVAEKLHGAPGLGAAATSAVARRDLSTLMSLAALGTVFTTVAIALGDAARRFADPRLAASKKRSGSG